MQHSVRAGLAYFAIVFAAGFLLGTVRILAGAPLLGETLAVVIELPVMLAISWSACDWLIARFAVPRTLLVRFAMGGVAFALLAIAEICVSVFGLGRTIGEHFENYLAAHAIIGLLGQFAFALFPVIQMPR